MKKIIPIILIIIIAIVILVIAIINKQTLKNKLYNTPGNGAILIESSNGFAGGSGTQEDPYQISNINELQHMADLFNEAKTNKDEYEKYAKCFYVLTADITLNSDETMANLYEKAPTYRWDPIGTAKGVNNYFFSGTFDGQGHSISGLYNYIYKGEGEKNTEYIGLFYNLTNATVKNLILKNAYFVVEKEAIGVGALAGTANGSIIDNVQIENVILNTNNTLTGGIIAKSQKGTSFSNCTVTGQISCKNNIAAGITAELHSGTIDNCTSSAIISIKDDEDSHGFGAGIVGNVEDESKSATKVINCINNGNIVGEKGNIAGVVLNINKSDESILINNCKNTGSIENKGNASGIVYSINTSNSLKDSLAKSISISNVENSGSIKSAITAGGIISEMKAEQNTIIEIKNSNNLGTIESQIIGGIAGNARIQEKSSIIIDSCINSGLLKCTDYCIGGIIGRLNYVPSDISEKSLNIKNCINNGEINSDNAKVLAGIFGIYETNQGSKDTINIENCINNANINGKTPVWMGGIAGYIQDNNSDIKLTIKSCGNNGQFNYNITNNEANDVEDIAPLEWNNYAGGIVAVINKNATLENNVNIGRLNEEGEKFEAIKFNDNYCYQAE